MKLVLTDFMSLDGVVQGPGGPEEDTEGGFTHGGWSMPYFDEEAMGAAIDETMNQADALLYGRRTWQVMAAHWPDQGGDPFADKINEIRKYVASRTLSQDDVTWTNSHLLPKDDVFGAVERLKAEDGGLLLMWGSANFARQLVERDLVDELHLMIVPVILGGGKRLFPEDGSMRAFELDSATTASTGVQICRYKRQQR